MGSQHPSPNVKTFCKFEPQIWLEILTSRDAKSACFKGSRTSTREIIFGIFWPNFGQKRSHHVMDASCRQKTHFGQRSLTAKQLSSWGEGRKTTNIHPESTSGGVLIGCAQGRALIGRREKTLTPKTRFSSWTLLRTPGRFTTRPLPVCFTTKMSVVRRFSVLSKDEIGP